MHLDQIAAICHAANLAFQLEHGDATPSRHWDQTTDEIRNIVRAGVRGFLTGDTPADSHHRWMQTKTDQGWTWGPVKDRARKTHPCMVPFDDLMEHEKAKDLMMHGIVTALAPLLEENPTIPQPRTTTRTG